MAESFADYSFRIGMLKVSSGSVINVSAPFYSKNKDIKLIIQRCYIKSTRGPQSTFVPSRNNVFELMASTVKRFAFTFPASEINSYSDGSVMEFEILNETDSIVVTAVYVFRHSIGWSLQVVTDKPYIVSELGEKPSAECIENTMRRNTFRGWLNQQLSMERWPFSEEKLMEGLRNIGIPVHDLYSETDPAMIRLYASELVMKRSRCELADSKEYGKAVELLLDYAEFLDWMKQPGHNEKKLLDIPGHVKCTSLRELRRKVARANQIPYDTEECDNLGPCWGTCPKCDEEVAYLDRELQKKKERGERIVLQGLGDEVLDMYGEYAETSPESSIADGGLSFGGLSMMNEENEDLSWGPGVYFEPDEADIVEDTNERENVRMGALYI